MLIGVNTWVWTSPLRDADIPALAAKARSMGFDLLELPLETLDGYDRREARAALEAEGLAASSTLVFPPDRDLIHPDAAPRENAARYIRGAIDAAAELGSQTLSGPLYASVGRAWQQTADERERDMERLVEALTPLSAHAADAGVRLGLEPLNRFETSFVNIAEQAVEIIDRVDSPARLPARHVPHEHRGEVDRRRHPAGPAAGCSTSTPARTTAARPGRGTCRGTRWPPPCATIEFAAPVVIESFTDEVVTIAAAAAVWRPVAASQDALAAEGGAFLQGLLK